MAANASAALDAIMQGHFVEGALLPYYDLLGGFFYVWAFALTLIMLFGKSQNYGVITIVGLLIAPVVLLMIPREVHLLIYFFIALGITGILYKLYH